MGIASLTFSAFSHPLHALTRWLQPIAMQGGHDSAAARLRTCKAPVPAHAAPAWPTTARMPRDEIALPATGTRSLHPAPGADPLCNHVQARRVVRVLRTAASGADAGRLVISGRMADVCAELDRMAAREALLQH
ncbi:hypothetical protein PMI14_05485 [Acidovorax sp. CF316]|uniref:hypothetical protein n=1 Tax=Acidovorax sp. CF316 TaxID=1144317 RepID=UPI00026BDF93|nr:hypothetical protein [Acidovorax sp. CF316]EJE49915.1 hypothetical protein PMI14_05485 [Acidovorax sp. CF316]